MTTKDNDGERYRYVQNHKVQKSSYMCQSMYKLESFSVGQLDSSFVSEYIETLVNAKMTITVAAIQAVVAEQFGYQIFYQKTMNAKRKAMTRLFGDWYKSYVC